MPSWRCWKSHLPLLCHAEKVNSSSLCMLWKKLNVSFLSFYCTLICWMPRIIAHSFTKLWDVQFFLLIRTLQMAPDKGQSLLKVSFKARHNQVRQWIIMSSSLLIIWRPTWDLSHYPEDINIGHQHHATTTPMHMKLLFEIHGSGVSSPTSFKYQWGEYVLGGSNLSCYRSETQQIYDRKLNRFMTGPDYGLTAIPGQSIYEENMRLEIIDNQQHSHIAWYLKTSGIMQMG